ncbi:MAG: hypothetical protein COV75_03050 [Candidatus Omnitrophica bacterium CG11_big_fil_rev_8_21_14_0_20_63_9]|nr:MAG: hypothetical protein COV75_03050 [Candidatus Omnitrophica bacterium CG11_big_fil_rev_8_21_14_0_20_63_9]
MVRVSGWLAGVFGMGLLLAGKVLAEACTCPDSVTEEAIAKMTPQEWEQQKKERNQRHFDAADVIVAGEVIHVEPHSSRPDYEVATLAVHTIWKGPQERTIQVASSTQEECGALLGQSLNGVPLIVYAKRSPEGLLMTDLCMGTGWESYVIFSLEGVTPTWTATPQ